MKFILPKKTIHVTIIMDNCDDIKENLLRDKEMHRALLDGLNELSKGNKSEWKGHLDRATEICSGTQVGIRLFEILDGTGQWFLFPEAFADLMAHTPTTGQRFVAAKTLQPFFKEKRPLKFFKELFLEMMNSFPQGLGEELVQRQPLWFFKNPAWISLFSQSAENKEHMLIDLATSYHEANKDLLRKAARHMPTPSADSLLDYLKKRNYLVNDFWIKLEKAFPDLSGSPKELVKLLKHVHKNNGKIPKTYQAKWTKTILAGTISSETKSQRKIKM